MSTSTRPETTTDQTSLGIAPDSLDAVSSDDPISRTTLLQLFDALTAWHRAGEMLHARGTIRERSGVDLKRWLHPVLFVIAAGGPVRVNDIAVALGILHSTASRHVGQLVDDGYVDRTTDPSDARACHLVLTGHGRAAHAALVRAWTTIFADSLAGQPSDQAAMLTDAFAGFVAGVARHAE